MRTNIDIDDQLMNEALAAGPFKTKKEAVEAGLVLLKRQSAMRELAKMAGTVSWGWGDEERLDGKPNWQFVAPSPSLSPSLSPLAGKAAAQHHVGEPLASDPGKKANKQAGTAKAESAAGVRSRARR